MRHPSRRQVVVLAVLVIWALLLAVGLFGGSVVGLPRAITIKAGTVALVAVFWFMPGGYLFALASERRQGAIRPKGMGALAIRWLWRFAVTGALVVLVGLLLLVPSAQATPELRVAGAVMAVWGVIALSVAILAFRTKPWLTDASHTR